MKKESYLAGVLERDIIVRELGLEEIIYLLENHSNVATRKENGDLSINLAELAKAVKPLITKITDIKQGEICKIGAVDLVKIARKLKEVNEDFLPMVSEFLEEIAPAETPKSK